MWQVGFNSLNTYCDILNKKTCETWPLEITQNYHNMYVLLNKLNTFKIYINGSTFVQISQVALSGFK